MTEEQKQAIKNAIEILASLEPDRLGEEFFDKNYSYHQAYDFMVETAATLETIKGNR